MKGRLCTDMWHQDHLPAALKHYSETVLIVESFWPWSGETTSLQMFWTVERQRMISMIRYLFRLKSFLLTSSDTSASLNFRPAVVFSAVFSSAARRRASCDPGPSRIQHFYFDASGRFFKRAGITCSMQHEHPHWQCLGCPWGRSRTTDCPQW